MNCHLATDQLHAFHDGELDPPTQRSVAGHLGDCPTCQAQLDQLQQLGSYLRQHGAETPGPELLAGILRHANSQPTRSGGFLALLPRLAAAGLGALLIGAAGMAYAPMTPRGARSADPVLTGSLASYLRPLADSDSALLAELRRLHASPEGRILNWARISNQTPSKEQGR